MAGTENRHLAAGSGGAGAASDQPHARHWTNLALATGQCKAQAKTGRFLPRPGTILTPMRDTPGHDGGGTDRAAKSFSICRLVLTLMGRVPAVHPPAVESQKAETCAQP